MQLTSGSRVRRYEIESLLGRGGMGEVYRARDVELGRSVALKVLPHFEGDEDADERVRRFVQEAKAAVALNHPNVAHLYDAGDESGVRFIAMELVEGETLRERMRRRPFTVDEALDVAIQIASALADAHAHGIVHRDIKPDNVMLRPDGYVKVLDFGLAKLTQSGTVEATLPVQTQTGAIVGTVHYMSPEQLCGQPVDGRTDIFSLGVLLYELLAGRRPFEAPSPSAVIAAILTEEPQPLDNVPAELDAIVRKAVAKKHDDRFATAGEMVTALRLARGSGRVRSGDVPTQILTATQVRRMPKRLPWIVVGVLVVAAIVIFAARQVAQKQRVDRARAELPRLEKLAEERQYFAAWDLAKSIEPLVDDSRLGRAIQKVSTEMTATSDPAGAQVFVQRILADGSVDAARETIGTTPFEKKLIAMGDYVVTIEKDGHAPFSRTIQAQPVRHGLGLLLPPRPPVLNVQLAKREAVPPEMVAVEGGPYRLTGSTRATIAQITLAPFLIDRYEVSNQDFERFVRDGGYRRQELWKHPFVRDGKTLSFAEAMALMRDATGGAGPRSWANGSFPLGREKYPVTDITWYEAAAYAEWAGKRLPTIYEWDKTARNGLISTFGNTYPWGSVTQHMNVSLRANFGSGPKPVDSMPSGMSMWGAYHMAGNVAEWLRNPNENGYAVIGGAFEDPMYVFFNIGAYPGFFAGSKIGFRCVKSSGDQGAIALATDHVEAPVYKPVSEAEFAKVAAHFAYERTPVDAKVVERIRAKDWIREKIVYKSPKGADVPAYLYLPTGTKPPYQVIHMIPAGDVASGFRPLHVSIEDVLVGVMREGRAVFGVVLEGYLERENTAPRPDPNSPEGLQQYVDHATELRRGLDYLASRPDIDAKKIGVYAPSAGSMVGMIVTAVDDRYASVVLMGVGVGATDARVWRPEIARATYAPYIAAPKLLLHGRYDEAHPYRIETEPLLRLMREPKEFVLFEGGHIPTKDFLTPTLLSWYDKTLGPVR